MPAPAPNPLPAPTPNPGGGDPLGQLMGALGNVGEGLSGGASRPMDGDPTTGVQLYYPQMMGQLEQGAIEQVLRAAQQGMATCRQPGQAIRVRIQGQITFNRLDSIGAAQNNTGPQPTAQCVANQFRRTIPVGWSPGQAGVFFFDVELSAR